jgi:hypothetical protein
VKTSVFMTSLCLGVLASGAFAADVSIKGNVSETVDGSNNYFLSNMPSGYTIRDLSAINLDVMARTPTTSYLLDTNYSYYKYFGPGAADAGGLTSGTPASATFTINHTTELEKYNIAASWSRSDATQTQLTQSGTATAHGSINTYGVNGGVTRDLGRNDSISWTANASTVSFTDPTQTPYVDFTTMVSWNHNLSATTTLNNSVSFDWFSQDDPAKSQRLFWSVMTGLQSQLSSRLTFNGNVGVDFANSYQNGVAQSPIPPIPPGVAPFQPQVGAGHGWVGNIGLTYQLLKNTSVSLTAAQAIIPTFTGQLQQSESIGMSLSHTINQFASLSFFTSYAQASSPGQIGQASTASDFFSASVNFGYQLTRDWRTNLSYTYRDNVDVATSSTILFALSHDFTVLGNPAAINQAEQERAKARARQSIGQVFPTFQ